MATKPTDLPEAVFGDSSEVLEFGVFSLLPRRRQLLRNGEPVRIGGRAFDLLTLLAARAGEIVSHADLIAKAWPNRVVVDANLKTQVASLQKLLGRTSDGGRFIECVALRGYTFVEDVRVHKRAFVEASAVGQGVARLLLVVDVSLRQPASHEPASAAMVRSTAVDGMLQELGLPAFAGGALTCRLLRWSLAG